MLAASHGTPVTTMVFTSPLVVLALLAMLRHSLRLSLFLAALGGRTIRQPSNLFIVTWQYRLLRSQPIQLRFNVLAATKVLPAPQKQSSTVCPGCVSDEIKNPSSSTGFGQGCSFLSGTYFALLHITNASRLGKSMGLCSRVCTVQTQALPANPSKNLSVTRVKIGRAHV